MLYKNNDTGMFVVINESDNYGYNYYLFDEDYSLKDGGCCYDINEDGLSAEEVKENRKAIEYWDNLPKEYAVHQIMNELGVRFDHSSLIQDEEMEEKLLENA